MKTGKFIKCPRCGSRVETKLIDVQVNTTTPFSKWRVDEVADCVECGYLNGIDKGQEE